MPGPALGFTASIPPSRRLYTILALSRVGLISFGAQYWFLGHSTCECWSLTRVALAVFTPTMLDATGQCSCCMAVHWLLCW